MPRAKTRARRRRARREELRDELELARMDPQALWALLARVAGSEEQAWALAKLAPRDRPLDEDEMAMIAQAVAPHLAGMTPGSVQGRHNLAVESRVSESQ